MKKKEIQILLILFGFLAGFASWRFYYQPTQAKISEIETQNEELKLTVNRLEGYEMQKQHYKDETERLKTEGDSIIVNFAPGLMTEDIIMYLYGLELVDANDVAVPAVTLTDMQEKSYGGAMSKDGYDLVDDGIRFYDEETTVNIVTTNNGLKNIMRYIYSYMPRKAVSEINLSVLENGYLSGTMLVNFYCMTGTEIPYQQVNIPAIVTGTDNIFGSRNGTGTVLPDAEGEESAEGEEGEEGAEAGEEGME